MTKRFARTITCGDRQVELSPLTVLRRDGYQPVQVIENADSTLPPFFSVKKDPDQLLDNGFLVNKAGTGPLI